MKIKSFNPLTVPGDSEMVLKLFVYSKKGALD